MNVAKMIRIRAGGELHFNNEITDCIFTLLTYVLGGTVCVFI